MARNAARKAGPSNHEHPGEPHLRNFNSAMRVGRGGRRATTVVSGEMSALILQTGSAGKSTGAYARLLAEELPREAPPRNGQTLASFFCCGGGIDLGFRSAGFETVLANDVHKAAADTFEANLGHKPVLRDVREVGAGDHAGGPVDVVTGGFPCVTFSMAGRRAGVTDDENGKLYLELCRQVEEFKPRYFVAENVKGMLSSNGGAAIKLVLAAFLRLGYRTAYELVNMAEHGVPQTRERVVFVGVRLDEWRGAFPFPRKTRRLARDKAAKLWLPPAVTLREAIGDLPPPGEKLVGMMHGDAAAKAAQGHGVSGYQSSQPRHAGQPSHSMVSSQGGVLLDEQHAGGHEPNDAPVSPTHAMSKRRAHGGRPSPTVVSEAANVQPLVRRSGSDVVAARNPDFHNPMIPAGNPGPTMTAGGQAEALERGGQLRRMTVRECARVQSFPDWYEFKGSQSDGYRIVGNAVPPLYAKRLALALLEYDRRPKLG